MISQLYSEKSCRTLLALFMCRSLLYIHYCFFCNSLPSYKLENSILLSLSYFRSTTSFHQNCYSWWTCFLVHVSRVYGEIITSAISSMFPSYFTKNVSSRHFFTKKPMLLHLLPTDPFQDRTCHMIHFYPIVHITPMYPTKTSCKIK